MKFFARKIFNKNFFHAVVYRAYQTIKRTGTFTLFVHMNRHIITEPVYKCSKAWSNSECDVVEDADSRTMYTYHDLLWYAEDRQKRLEWEKKLNRVATDAHMGFEMHFDDNEPNPRYFFPDTSHSRVISVHGNESFGYVRLKDSELAQSSDWEGSNADPDLATQFAGRGKTIRSEFDKYGLLSVPREKPHVGDVLKIFDIFSKSMVHATTTEDSCENHDREARQAAMAKRFLQRRQFELDTSHMEDRVVPRRVTLHDSPHAVIIPSPIVLSLPKYAFASKTARAHGFSKGTAYIPCAHFTPQGWIEESGDLLLENYFSLVKRNTHIPDSVQCQIVSWKDLLEEDEGHMMKLRRTHAFDININNSSRF